METGMQVQRIESMCMACGATGTTTLLLLTIPHFREVVISRFECPHCHHADSKVDSAATIQPQGVRYSVPIKDHADLGRTVVRGEFSTVLIPEVGFEDPNNAREGNVTTVEGVLAAIRDNVRPLYKQDTDTPQMKALRAFLDKLDGFIERGGCTLVVSDPSGNSFVGGRPGETELAGDMATRFTRTPEQCALLGLDPEQEAALAEKERLGVVEAAPEVVGRLGDEDAIAEVPSPCPLCHHDGTLRTQTVAVPHFKEIVLLAFVCDNCHFRTVEVKPTGPIEDHGTRITLRLTDDEDLKRDVLKGAFASVELVELGVKAQAGTLGGVFTSLEGLLVKMRDQMREALSHLTGDAADAETREKVLAILDGVDKCARGAAFPFTLVIDDPTSNSYIQNIYAPDPDPELALETYTRTREQDDELGLNDMKVDDYE